jgi:transcriptional regulator with XRE-family HTH domain
VPFRYDEIGERLKAFRLGSRLSADEIAKKIDISRTALYRLEKGELVKLETLEKLSDLLGVSIPTMLGVGTEYISSAVSYFERLRQLEARSNHIVVLAGPISFLLSSERFHQSLEQVLRESIGEDVLDREGAFADIAQIMEILEERKRTYAERKPNIVNLISALDIERFVRNGFTGRPFIPEELQQERRLIARAEIEHFAKVIEEESIGVQIGLFTRSLPHTGFQIFRQQDQKSLTISPFRLGEQPNVRVGVAMITSAPEALMLHERVVTEMWRTALKGPAAAKYLRELIARANGTKEAT